MTSNFFFGYEHFVLISLDNALCFGLFLFLFFFYKLDTSNIKNNFVLTSFFRNNGLYVKDFMVDHGWKSHYYIDLDT